MLKISADAPEKVSDSIISGVFSRIEELYAIDPTTAIDIAAMIAKNDYENHLVFIEAIKFLTSKIGLDIPETNLKGWVTELGIESLKEKVLEVAKQQKPEKPTQE